MDTIHAIISDYRSRRDAAAKAVADSGEAARYIMTMIPIVFLVLMVALTLIGDAAIAEGGSIKLLGYAFWLMSYVMVVGALVYADMIRVAQKLARSAPSA